MEKIGREWYYDPMIERRDIEKLALLARIALSESELVELQADVDAILEHISEIQEAGGDTAIPQETDLNRNVFRDDAEPHPKGIFTEALLVAVPAREGKYVKVKKIL